MLVPWSGIEPPTPSLPRTCATISTVSARWSRCSVSKGYHTACCRALPPISFHVVARMVANAGKDHQTRRRCARRRSPLGPGAARFRRARPLRRQGVRVQVPHRRQAALAHHRPARFAVDTGHGSPGGERVTRQTGGRGGPTTVVRRQNSRRGCRGVRRGALPAFTLRCPHRQSPA